jgi:hypothetical protein
MRTPKDSLLLVTSLSHEDRAEDLFLADALSNTWDVTITSPTLAANILAVGAVNRCLIRNAWPSRVFREDFHVIEALAQNRRIDFYNPLGRERGPIEDKTYLYVLFRAGLPVIPTYLTAAEVAALGCAGQIICKPIDGCSSEGIIEAAPDSLPTTGEYIFQPKIEFLHEVSYFFIDNRYAYAMQSSGASMAERWDLSMLSATNDEIAWAQQFVAWNKMHYGIQRIDACRLSSGELLLMEIEDSMPFLSLQALPPEAQRKVMDTLLESIRFHLSPARPRENLCNKELRHHWQGYER